MSKILIVLGSVTPPGRFDRALHAAVSAAQSSGIEAEIVSLADVELPFAGGETTEGATQFTARVGAADAVVLASPVYRATLTGALKNALDLLPVEALRGKPVGIVAMGASDHHSLGVESHLRDILAWFGALTAPVAVYLTSADFEDGQPGEQAVAPIVELLQTVTTLHTALGGERAPLGPTPLAARRNG